MKFKFSINKYKTRNEFIMEIYIFLTRNPRTANISGVYFFTEHTKYNVTYIHSDTHLPIARGMLAPPLHLRCHY